MLHHNNGPSHSSRVVWVTVKELDIEPRSHQLYSPDMAICDLWLFPNLLNRLHGQKYESREELMCAVNRHLQEMSRDGLQYAFMS